MKCLECNRETNNGTQYCGRLVDKGSCAKRAYNRKHGKKYRNDNKDVKSDAFDYVDGAKGSGYF